MINGKKIIGVAASVAMIAGVAACGGSSTNNTSASGDTTAAATIADPCEGGKDVTLTVWAPQEDQKDDTSWLQTEEAAFEKAYPNCKVTWKNSVVSEADAGSTVAQDASAAADVYMFSNDQLGTLISAGGIGEIPEGAYLDQIKAQNDDNVMASVTSDGKVYGVPYTGNTWFMYYDASVFSADDAKSLDTMLEKGKVSFPLTNGWYNWAFYAGAGATLFGDDGTNADDGAKLGDNAAAVTKYLVNLKHNKNFVLDDQGSGLGGLKDGSVNAIFSGTWDASNVKAALGDNYAAAQPPTFNLDGTDTQMKAFYGTKAAAYNPKSANAGVAMALAVFLGGTDAQKAHYEMRSIVPSDKSLASDSKVSADPAAVAQMNTIANAATIQPTLKAMNGFWDVAAGMGKGIDSGEVTTDNASSKTDDFQTGLNAALDKAAKADE